MGLGGVALAALTPTLGYSMLSEVFVPNEIYAFEDAEAILSRLRGEVRLLQDTSRPRVCTEPRRRAATSVQG